jgi:phage FluMu gp28-like protein
VALDATGNGAYLAEVTVQRYGAHRAEGIHLTEAWYRAHMPKLKAAFEDGGLTIPADAGVVDDFRQLELVRGVARVPDKRQVEKGEEKDKAGGQRHGDAAIAAALAIYAAGRDVGDGRFAPVSRPAEPPYAGFVGVGSGAGLGVADYLG